MAIVALFVFSLLYIAPGDPAAIIAGDQASPADVERIRAGPRPRPALPGPLRRVALERAARRSRHLDLHQPAGHQDDRAAARADHLAHDADPDPVDRHRGADGRAGGLEAGHLDRPAGHGRWRCSASPCRCSWSATCWPMSSRCSSIGSRCRATRRSPTGSGRGCQPDPALDRARRRLYRADRPHHAGDDAGGAEPGLRARPPRPRASAAGPSCSCTR